MNPRLRLLLILGGVLLVGAFVGVVWWLRARSSAGLVANAPTAQAPGATTTAPVLSQDQQAKIQAQLDELAKRPIDSDGDGLSDQDEINVYHTDPHKWDTDGDGFGDGEEVKVMHTDPLKPDPLSAAGRGSGPPPVRTPAPVTTTPAPAPAATTTVANPNGDDDHDGLSNADEAKYGTDPHNPDTDGDGLTDGDEVHKYGTNPLNPDTDGDGYKDGDEVKNGYNPLGPGRCPTPGCIVK